MNKINKYVDDVRIFGQDAPNLPVEEFRRRAGLLEETWKSFSVQEQDEIRLKLGRKITC